GALGREDLGVGPEGDAGAGAPPRRLAGDGQLALGPAAVGEDHVVVLAVEVDVELEPLRQGVDDGHTDAVQTTRDLVTGAPKLAAGVEHGEDDFGRRLALVLW